MMHRPHPEFPMRGKNTLHLGVGCWHESKVQGPGAAELGGTPFTGDECLGGLAGEERKMEGGAE